MNQQSRLQKPRDGLRPIDGCVKGIQLPGVMKAVKDERHQTKNVKVNSARSVPAANENEQPNEDIEKRGDPQIIFDRRGRVLRRSHQRRLKSGLAAMHLVAHFSPGTRVKQDSRNICRAMNRNISHGQHDVALFDSCLGGWRVGDDMPSYDTLLGVQPSHTIVWKNKSRTLLEVEESKYNCR